MSGVTKQPTSDATPATAPPPPPRRPDLPDVRPAVMVTQLLEVALRASAAPVVSPDGARSSPELARDDRSARAVAVPRAARAPMLGCASTSKPERRFALGPLGPTATEVRGRLPMGHRRRSTRFRATVQDGTPGMELAHGMPIFEYLTRHPAAGRNFDVAMNAHKRGGARGGRGELRLHRRAHAGRCRRRQRERHWPAMLTRHPAPARRAVRPAGGDRERSPQGGRARDVQSWVAILRADARTWRRVPSLPRHPRLGRGTRPDDPSQLPGGDGLPAAGCCSSRW